MENYGRLDYWLKNTWLKVARIYNQEAQREGVTLTIGQILVSIDKEGTPSSSLGPMLGMEASSLTRTMKSLFDKGWIEKKQDDLDKRISLVFLTSIGVEKRKIAKKKIEDFNNHMKNALPKEYYEVFFEAIKVINIEVDNYSSKIFNLEKDDE
jgi:MarR family transcriptional regulator, organic hydroperoxide resistance regulator